MEKSSNPDHIGERRGNKTNQPTLGIYNLFTRIPLFQSNMKTFSGRSSGPPRRRRIVLIIAYPRVRHLPRARHLPHERYREDEPQEPGRPQGRHARVQERGDDCRHPESVSATRETLICTVLCNANSLFIADAVNIDRKKGVYSDSSLPRRPPSSP